MHNGAGRRYFAPDSEVTENEDEQLDSIGNASEFYCVSTRYPFRITAGIPTILHDLYSRCAAAGSLLHISSTTLKSRCADLSTLLSQRLCVNKTVRIS